VLFAFLIPLFREVFSSYLPICFLSFASLPRLMRPMRSSAPSYKARLFRPSIPLRPVPLQQAEEAGLLFSRVKMLGFPTCRRTEGPTLFSFMNFPPPNCTLLNLQAAHVFLFFSFLEAFFRFFFYKGLAYSPSDTWTFCLRSAAACASSVPPHVLSRIGGVDPKERFPPLGHRKMEGCFSFFPFSVRDLPPARFTWL